MARTSLCLSADPNVFTFRLTLLTPLQSDVFVPIEVVVVVIVVVVVVEVVVVMIGVVVVVIQGDPRRL